MQPIARKKIPFFLLTWTAQLSRPYQAAQPWPKKSNYSKSLSYEGAPTDGSARIEEKLTKVLRGGSWSNNTRFWIAGSGARFNSAPGNASNNIGFRIVLPLE